MFAERTDLTDGVGYAFTDRHDGHSRAPFASLNLGRTDVDDPQHVADNFTAVGDALGLPAAPVVALAQQHTADVLVVDADWPTTWGRGGAWPSPVGSSLGGPRLPVADAVVTALPDVVLAVRVADCLPVVLADPTAGVIAVAHAGRVGLAAGILPATVATLRRHGATTVTARIGPSVCGGCYEVPEEMARELGELVPGSRARTTWGTASLDLGAGAVRQLQAEGVQVTVNPRCTREDADLFSHRRDGAGSGRLAALIWRRGSPAAP